LAVSRSEEAGGSGGYETDPADLTAEEESSRRIHWPRRDEVEFNELNVHLKISYKTLILVFVLFDVFHKLVDAVDLDSLGI